MRSADRSKSVVVRGAADAHRLRAVAGVAAVHLAGEGGEDADTGAMAPTGWPREMPEWLGWSRPTIGRSRAMTSTMVLPPRPRTVPATIFSAKPPSAAEQEELGRACTAHPGRLQLR